MNTHPADSAGEDGDLSRRERQIMDIVYSTGEASARHVWERLPDPPSYATVRTLLRILMEKGQLQHRVEGRSFIYSPKKSPESVAKGAWQRLLRTFYGGSIEQAITGLLDPAHTKLQPEEVRRIEELLKAHKTAAENDQPQS